ncbi:DUF5659 domain-containing protein [Clostridium perfringens]|uniref:DUF5659 domain-containing protein n=1 Tax=Clostridium perfringens TaxID=1502 RepID=UPI000DF0FF8E|nr:DUF5659 domain-containing protein [Clostridium perfringens]MDK0749128.1 DUF5659 domain-containing protein [Clostridium perfringens]MDK0762571.1 DUF5659 domain-containing protein [Clostridium perfringens]MDM0767592.1 DUF5659 domain-containing protein [Clostridium perfringens]MDM0886617.1 DUF5659 domain-containing protein [Clostridium perfringens]MDM0893006.1 DUF5659 domain-containing protein [Clostridium perfringens]
MYIVKTIRQMQYLVRNGFDCKKIEKSLKDSERVVFAFEKTDELMKCMREYFRQAENR